MLASASRATSLRSLVSRSRSFASVSDAAGLRVASFDNGEPTSSVTVLVKAGSRHGNKPGIAHILKNFGFKNTTERSSLRTVREAELYGGVLSSSLSREHLAYSAEFLGGDESHFVDILSAVLTSTRFTRYELEESVLPVVQAESSGAYADPATRAVELAHALAFRSGLGDSLFAPPHADITVDDVQTFAAGVFNKSNIAVLGTGIAQDVLTKLVQKHLRHITEVPASASSPPPTTYYGGETRVPFFDQYDHASHTVFIGFGTPGAPSPELTVLAAHLSPASSLKWSAGTSPLSNTLPEGTSAQTIMLPYSDATLFGLLVQGKTPEAVKEAGRVVVQTLKNSATSTGVKAEDVKRAIAKAKFLTASAMEGREGLIGTFGHQLLSGSETFVDAIPASLEKVNTSTLTRAVSNLIKTKPTFVAVGDTYKLPYADELGL